jgi:hypothetical protein
MVQKCTDFDDRLDALEQYSRRNCLLIHGVPEKDREDCLSIAENFFAEKLSVKINPVMLGRAHRIGPLKVNADNIRPIIVRFLSYQDRERVWRAKKALKGSGHLVTESLTATRKKLLQSAKDLAGPRNVWTQDGKIIIKRESGARVYVSSSKDLEKARRLF